MKYLESIYHRLPPPIRETAASIKGYQLRFLRHPGYFKQLVEQFRSNESLSYNEIREIQHDRLSMILSHSAQKVPFYRSYWQNQTISPSSSYILEIENWPVLDRVTVQANPHLFHAEGVRATKAASARTSGSSGAPLKVVRTREALVSWYALYEVRWRQSYGASISDRWGLFGGRPVVSPNQVKPPYWVKNWGLKQLYLSPAHLGMSTVTAYNQAIDNFGAKYLVGYPTALETFATLACENDLSPPKLRFILTNGELLTNDQRTKIADYFGCPVYNSYGMAESVAGASECLEGRLHLWPEAGFVEILDFNTPKILSSGETGRIVCTGLLNTAMPLIRYEIGDVGAKSIGCRCDCSFEILSRIEGRLNDAIYGQKGNKIFLRINGILDGLPVRQTQIRQLKLGTLNVLIVPREGFGVNDRQEIVRRLVSRVGNLNIIIKIVPEIPSTNGKHRLVVNEI